MGMKGEGNLLNQEITQKLSEIITKQNKLLADLDQQYEESRFLTHRAKGVGFGLGGNSFKYLGKNSRHSECEGP